MTPLEHKNEAAVKINEVLERIRDVANSSGNNTQTIVHQGLGAWGPAAITACFSTLMLMLLMSIIFVYLLGQQQRQIGDLQAWKDIHAAKIARLEATLPKGN